MEGDLILCALSFGLKDARVASARASNRAIPRVIGIDFICCKRLGPSNDGGSGDRAGENFLEVEPGATR